MLLLNYLDHSLLLLANLTLLIQQHLLLAFLELYVLFFSLRSYLKFLPEIFKCICTEKESAFPLEPFNATFNYLQ